MFRITTRRLAVCVNTAMKSLMENFAEARELIEDATESKDTSYFAADLSDAVDQVNLVWGEYNKLLSDLKEEGRDTEHTTIQKENDLKFRQLLAEIEKLQHDDD